MKKYVTPMMECEEFVTNEYVAACFPYRVFFDVGSGGGQSAAREVTVSGPYTAKDGDRDGFYTGSKGGIYLDKNNINYMDYTPSDMWKYEFYDIKSVEGIKHKTSYRVTNGVVESLDRDFPNAS